MELTVLLGFALFFVAVWYTIGAGLARLGGWSILARPYSAPYVPVGKKFRMQSIAFGWVEYNGGVTIVVSEIGLYLSMWRFVLVAHPPLLIPWSALHVMKIRESRWTKDATLAVDGPSTIKLRVPLRVIEAAQSLLPLAKDREGMGAEEL